jgi:hypothetical protein
MVSTKALQLGHFQTLSTVRRANATHIDSRSSYGSSFPDPGAPPKSRRPKVPHFDAVISMWGMTPKCRMGRSSER